MHTRPPQAHAVLREEVGSLIRQLGDQLLEAQLAAEDGAAGAAAPEGAASAAGPGRRLRELQEAVVQLRASVQVRGHGAVGHPCPAC